MNNGIGYITDKVKEYSKIPSLTYKEDDFLAYLANDIPSKYYTLNWVKSEGKRAPYLHYRYNGKTQWLVLAHVDRISVPPFTFQIQDNRLIGQLDNVISVAMCRYLMEHNMPVDFMFTTQEETCSSADQILNVWEKNPDYYVVDMDIDVSVTKDEIDCGAISLRSKDNRALYNDELVNLMRGLADKHKVQYLKKDGHWLVCQIGTALELSNCMKGMYLGLPIFDYHSNHEVINIECVKNALNLFDGIRESVQNTQKEYV
jgi:putative aminopeptidase FrvX